MNAGIIAILLAAILVANLVLFALRRISGAVFWFIIIIIGFTAYFVLPRLKK